MSGFTLPSSAQELRSRYLLITRSPVKHESLNAAGELVTILTSTRWVQIALIQCPETEKVVNVEVEVSIPSNDGISYEELLTGMIIHLNYLKCIVEQDFILTIIRDDCLWVASKTYSSQPKAEVFDALLPPTL